VIAPVEVGFYGKLPALGDFFSRRVDPVTVERWDHWLQDAVAASRQALGEAWLETYLTAPMWRFVLPAGVVGERAMAGVLFPSVDRVGRYFPFTVFAALPDRTVGLVVLDRCRAWFERIEDLVLSQLEDDARSLEDFESLLANSAERLVAGLEMMPAGPIAAPQPGSACLHLPLGERLDVAPVALAVLEADLHAAYRQPVLWCSAGSARIRPSWLVTEGLPVPEAYVAMLSGRWREWPWSSLEQESAAMVAGHPALETESAGSTHPGKVRNANQDAYVARPEVGLWMVADGMGGHTDGHVASQMTRDALAAVDPEADLGRWTQRVRGALADVNAWLYAASTRAVNPTVIGTTVVVLLIRGASAACLWAGDSRLYRLRNGVLEQLTRDHGDADLIGSSGESGNVITRAIGGRAELELDETGFDVRAGDRLLLCSDGLYREIESSEIAAMLATPAAADCVTTLIQRVLRGPAADNLTAVVVDVRGGADSAGRPTPASTDREQQLI